MRHLTHLRYIDVVAREKSIRKASEKLNITSTALNRRILALEEEVGTPLFARLPSGVRLNTAGELFIQHIRSQMTDLSRVLSQISDLSGVRRGHVIVGGGPEVLSSFLPGQIAKYRQDFQAVQFDVLRQTPEQSLTALMNFAAATDKTRPLRCTRCTMPGGTSRSSMAIDFSPVTIWVFSSKLSGIAKPIAFSLRI